MTSQSNSRKFEKLVVGAIRRLQDIQGSTSKEISDYLSQEYDVPSSEIKKQVRLALRRGVSYGILQRNNGNTFICNKTFLDQQCGLKKKGEIGIPCPWLRSGELANKRQPMRQLKRQNRSKYDTHKSRGHRKSKRKHRNRTRRKRRQSHHMKSSKKKQPSGKNNDCYKLLRLALVGNGKGRKSVIKKSPHRHRTRRENKKKRGGSN